MYFFPFFISFNFSCYLTFSQQCYENQTGSAPNPLPPKEKLWSRLRIREPLVPVHELLQLFLDLKKLTLSTDGTTFVALESQSGSLKTSDTCGRVSSILYASAVAFQSYQKILIFAQTALWQRRTQFIAATEAVAM
jgi:hypothetical protein